MKEALYWKVYDNAIRCQLCPQLCLIDEGKVGLCLVRFNKNGQLFTLSYGHISSKALDPIEKKPLYHFHPGSSIFSIGSIGCNLGCAFCQNYRISHPKDTLVSEDIVEILNSSTNFLPIEKLVDEALASKPFGNIGVAYTYNEPLMSYEYLFDACKAIKEVGLFNILVTNGYINPKPLEHLLPFIDAINIDLKGFSEEVYRQLEGHLTPVKKTIAIAAQSCHVEVTNLLVPGLNDDEAQIEDIVNWLAEIDSTIPLHFSRYFPAYQYQKPPTPLKVLEKARSIAEKKLKHVYLGNVPQPKK